MGNRRKGAMEENWVKKKVVAVPPSPTQGLLCPQELLVAVALSHGATGWIPRERWQCLSLGCDRKQEVPVISQDTLTSESKPVKPGRPPTWGGKVWPSVKNSWLPVGLWVC